jgi:hypothetical protein
MIKKAFLTGSIAFLFIALSFIPVIAQTIQTPTIEDQEAMLMEKFMNDVEQCASESHSSNEFMEKILTLCQNNDYSNFPVIREFIDKIRCFLERAQDFHIVGIDIQDLLDKITSRNRPDYLVISYGAYHRLNPLKENTIARFKEGLSMWRYSDTSMLLKGRTLIIERQPFGIHQKMAGPQLGIMKGFKGIYLDVESKLTGNSYVFFMGRVQRIRAFDLTPLHK